MLAPMKWPWPGWIASTTAGITRRKAVWCSGLPRIGAKSLRACNAKTPRPLSWRRPMPIAPSHSHGLQRHAPAAVVSAKNARKMVAGGPGTHRWFQKIYGNRCVDVLGFKRLRNSVSGLLLLGRIPYSICFSSELRCTRHGTIASSNLQEFRNAFRQSHSQPR